MHLAFTLCFFTNVFLIHIKACRDDEEQHHRMNKENRIIKETMDDRHDDQTKDQTN